jgi:hypothetical protein
MKDTTPLGYNIAPTPESSNPVAASGQTLDQTSSTGITVEAGEVYVVTAVVGYVCLGIAAVSAAAKLLWVATAGGPSIHVCIPDGVTTLYYICVGSSPKAFLRKVSQ